LKGANRSQVAEILIKEGADVNAKDGNGATPLHPAAMQGHLEIIEQLLNAGVEVVASGRDEAVKLLVQNDADIDAKDEYKRTPLHFAVYEGRLDTAELLIELGANVNARDWIGFTPLHYASSSCSNTKRR